ELALLLAELGKGDIGGNFLLAAEAEQLPPLPFGGPCAPGFDRAVGERLAVVRNHQVEIEINHSSEAAAGVAGAERAVEGEEVGGRFAVREVAARAFEACGVWLAPAGLVWEDQREPLFAEAERLFQRIHHASPLFGADRQAVGD